MDTKAKGIILRTVDYKDADKIANIFTLEQGVVSAKFVGVKKEKAKLKSCAQPFVFADFIFVQTGANRTVSSADIIDNFPNILNSFDKTICAYIVLEMVNSILPEQKPEADLFLITVNALKNIETSNEYVATIDYILKFVTFSGMGLEFFEKDYVFLDKFSGNFCTEHGMNTVEVDKKVYQVLKHISESKQSEHYNEFSDTTLKQALRLLKNIILVKFNTEIKSFQLL